MSAMASQITSLTIVHAVVYSGADQRKRAKLRNTELCDGNLPVTGEFLAQMASNAENVSIWWRHHEFTEIKCIPPSTFDVRVALQRCHMNVMALISPATQVFVQQFVHQHKRKSDVHITGSLWRESTGDRWIPRTEGQ